MMLMMNHLLPHLNHHCLQSLLNLHHFHSHLHYHHQSHYLHPNLLHCLLNHHCLNYRILRRKRTGSVHLRLL
jgi:hypothetical protein